MVHTTRPPTVKGPLRKVIYAQPGYNKKKTLAKPACVLAWALGTVNDKQPKTILLALIECKYNFALLSSLVSSVDDAQKQQRQRVERQQRQQRVKRQQQRREESTRQLC